MEPLIVEIKQLDKAEELHFYSTFLGRVIEHFEITGVKKFEVTYQESFDIYYHKCKHLYTSLESIEGKEVSVAYHQASSYAKNLPLILEGLNRFCSEQNIDKKFIAYLTEENVGIHELKREDIEKEKFLKPYGWDFIPTKYSYQEIDNAVSQYEERDVFKKLPKEIIERGKQLVRRRNLTILQDVLWDFENLIISCCPRESGEAYEGVLKNFINGTHGELEITNYQKTLLDEERCSISFEVNGKKVPTMSALPLEFSLLSIYQLNTFLSKEFGTSFYVWYWENNPWEQMTFIYLSNKTYEDYFNKSSEKEIVPFSDFMASWYDENR